MKRFGGYLLIMLFITVLIPSVIAKSVDIVSIKSISEGKGMEKMEGDKENKGEETKPIERRERSFIDLCYG